ncbi:ribonuclease [Pseudomonas sp. ICMP22404]|uniref:ribonuclease T2 family protein n=1 Tax=Pseudomonas TaxID=286 RepID=UPI00111810D5|nr:MULTISPECIES: ribonuclease T2 [Pseudomonas]MCI0997274.1 ribonuclease T2 [Pseudomonas corrugata]NUT65616.1 ribonuclease T2 [Pseudomonas corrugata]TNF84341.1 ribonuclease [Pseudomonas sp. ICMP22404]
MKQRFAIVMLLALTVGFMGMGDARESRSARAESVAGVFDYYVLSLSWSPTFCLTHSNDAQCSGKGYGFVLHGLWPQYVKGGWPQSCEPRVPLTVAEREKGLTLFPTRKLLEHEWSKHGTCTGLGAMGFLEASDKALAEVKVPSQLQPPSSSYYFEAKEIARLFRQSNPGIPADGIAVICSGPQLSEVRVCMDKDLTFASCGRGVKTQCRDGDVRVPPVR